MINTLLLVAVGLIAYTAPDPNAWLLRLAAFIPLVLLVHALRHPSRHR